MDPMGYSDFKSTAHSKSFFSPTAHRSRQPTYHLVIKHGKFRILYPLVICQNSYWKWPFIVDFPMKNMVIFHSFFVTLTRPGTYNKIGDLHHLTNKTPPRGCLMDISDIDQLPLSMLQEEVSQGWLVTVDRFHPFPSTCFLHKIHPSHEKNTPIRSHHRIPVFWLISAYSCGLVHNPKKGIGMCLAGWYNPYSPID